jgi:hypothetical protein
MKPKLLLGLALVLSGGLFGCVHHQSNGQPQSSGLTLRILVYPEKMDSFRIVPAFLVLSNGGFKPIRFSKHCYPLRAIGPDDIYDVTWLPGYVTSGGGAGTVEQFRQESEILFPDQTAEWPFMLYAPTNQTFRITAHYNTETSFPDAEELCKGAGLWIGQLDAEPVTIRFNK